jgi:hypothetical protein
MRPLAGMLVAVLCLPSFVSAQSIFGGPISQIIFCFNQAIYTVVGAPRGGAYVWTPGTRTYPFGPPSHSGQYVLGLSGAPYYCLVSVLPIIVFPGIAMTMVGSSQ